MLDVDTLVLSRNPKARQLPLWMLKPITYGLKKLFHQDEVNRTLERIGHLEGFDFIEAVLEYFNVSYSIPASEKLNIPPTGRVLIIANHPLGALDALSLLMLVKEVRPDVKIVANALLSHIDQLSNVLVPVDNMGGRSTKEHIKGIYSALEAEQALIIFPSGEVSRVRPSGVKDTKWQKGFLNIAKKTQAPLLPVYIKARNSSLFYTVSMVSKPLAALLLPHEMFTKRSSVVGFRVGEKIPFKAFSEGVVDEKQTLQLLKKHLYRIGKGKRGIFKTESCIAHPEERGKLQKELKNCIQLGQTSDGKEILLFDAFKESAIMREIGRLREMTFRKVEEGTGGRRDMDSFDKYYRHIIVWDGNELEIAGAYRIGEGSKIMQKRGLEGFYANSLCEYLDSFTPFAESGIELGRSFVQPKYWGSRALDYLWQGVGAYLRQHPDVKYMFGPVSLSRVYPKTALNMLVFFYSFYFPAKQPTIRPKMPFVMRRDERAEMERIFTCKDYKEDFRRLRTQLGAMDMSVPTLYKQYSELCEEGGCEFLGFNIDPDFGDCVDGMILVHIDKIKESKRARYLG
jgi:putative hemolysin